ncbi:MAG: PIG-L family deacetylase [Candidatus Gastranaerophilales bacterium]|nr:PIG-L family deacetylase [Candidatus Gastranaerophilales bacterium]
MIKKFLFKKFSYKFNKLAASINLKPQELNLSENKKCLCLCPHPDDESIGMGGLLALYPKLFDVILLTDGRKGIKNLSVEEVITIREEEFKNAMNIAGIEHYKCLHIEDKKLLSGFSEFKTINLEKYEYIFVPNIIDQHPDHKAVNILLKQLLDTGVKVKSELKICFYEVWSTLGFVNSFVDISNVVEIKKNMIKCYQSQTSQKNYEYHALGLNQYRGMFKDKKFLEAFFIMDLEEFERITELYYK